MKYLIGIDGGGSKTKLNCYDLSGKLIAEELTGPTDYHGIGIENVIQRLKDVLLKFNVDLSECLIGFGMPAYGENKADDEIAITEIKKAFIDTKINIDNDVVCAWAGATTLSPGITVVCGTGSMAVGRDPQGKFARSGGWCPLFSDEGSGYWLGLKTLEIFSKQSDFRLKRGPLYDVIRKHFNIKNDLDAIAIVNSQYENSREKIASLQMLLLEAYRLGDEAAINAYRHAVYEVAQVAVGAARQLDFGNDPIDLTYVGGLFNQKKAFLEPFTQEVNKFFKANVQAPKHSPCMGAVLLALEKCHRDVLEILLKSLQEIQ